MEKLVGKKFKFFTLLWIALVIALIGAVGYICCPYGYKTYYVNLPIRFNHSNLPCTEIELESGSHLVMIDLGSQIPLSLEASVMNGLKNKTEIGSSTSVDGFRNTYKCPSYRLPVITIGGLKIWEAFAIVRHPQRSKNVCLGSAPLEGMDFAEGVESTLGYPFLIMKNRPPFVRDWRILDFPHRSMVLTNSTAFLKKSNIDLKSYIKIPFSFQQEGVVLHIETDFGNLRFLIDTGATISTLDKKVLSDEVSFKNYYKFPTCSSQQFAINHNQFGAKELCVIDYPSTFNNIDGILGMDFLRHYIVCLDCKDQMAYIEYPKSDVRINVGHYDN